MSQPWPGYRAQGWVLRIEARSGWRLGQFNEFDVIVRSEKRYQIPWGESNSNSVVCVMLCVMLVW